MTINPKTMSILQLQELSRMSRQLSEWSENEIQNRQSQGTADWKQLHWSIRPVWQPWHRVQEYILKLAV